MIADESEKERTIPLIIPFTFTFHHGERYFKRDLEGRTRRQFSRKQEKFIFGRLRHVVVGCFELQYRVAQIVSAR